MLLLTEKNQKSVPTCEQGYWGGFSPKRKGGKYNDQHLTKRYTDGRARLYPARKMPRDNSTMDRINNLRKMATKLEYSDKRKYEGGINSHGSSSFM